jgi:hypothetical protein
MRARRPLLTVLVAGLTVAGLTVAGLTVSAAPAPARPATTAATAEPRLVDVRAHHRGDVDRVVFTFRGGVPSDVRAQYVDRLVGDPSGRAVRIAGRAVLQVRFESTAWIGGIPAPRRRAFALPNVMTAVRSGLFEGVTTYGIGLAKRTRVEVLRQPERNRVVVVVRAAFPTVERKVYFLDERRFLANTEPFFVARLRPVRPSAPARGVLDRLFAGPLDREKDHGLRLVRSRARDVAGPSISDRVARVRLLGGCSSGGSTVTIAGEIMPALRQFAAVDWVKIYDPAGRTAAPTGPSDSIPDCLNP